MMTIEMNFSVCLKILVVSNVTDYSSESDIDSESPQNFDVTTSGQEDLYCQVKRQ